MKKKIQAKIGYWTKQEGSFLEAFLRDNKRTSRDSLIRTRTRLEVYKEVLAVIEEEQIV